MKRAMILLAALLAAGSASAETYRIQEEGGFGSTGRLIEFADRYGWQSYSVDFNFGVDMETRALERRSSLDIQVTRKDGSHWSYRCSAKRKSGGLQELWANINPVLGRGVSVMTECRIPAAKFAKAVDLDSELVGEPTLVFSVSLTDGKAAAGAQKGFYFLASAQVAASPLAQYSTPNGDPSQLGVLFLSKDSPYQVSMLAPAGY
ncbi:MAG TPA: hypothetical protein VNI01_02020 [Elusimicrobiota bacterium]|jgi:hypothetical protein|nr:hypothetical protein [Elusimicrobiota bacterium]